MSIKHWGNSQSTFRPLSFPQIYALISPHNSWLRRSHTYIYVHLTHHHINIFPSSRQQENTSAAVEFTTLPEVE